MALVWGFGYSLQCAYERQKTVAYIQGLLPSLKTAVHHQVNSSAYFCSSYG